MTTTHSWRDLRAMPHVDVVWCPLPVGYHAVTDGQTIWMHIRLLQVERRCALTHELVHIDRGHTCCQPPTVEAAVQVETARRLLPTIEPVAEALAWAHDVDEAADELWVTPAVLRTRLEHLHPAERAYLKRRLECEA